MTEVCPVMTGHRPGDNRPASRRQAVTQPITNRRPADPESELFD